MAEKTLKSVRKSFLNYFAKKDHKIVDINFMKELYGDTNALTS